MFGPHLIIDGSRCDTRKLADRILVEQVLNDYPAAIGMTKIGGPYMFEYQAPDPAYSGVSGLVVIAESHIAIHTFPALDYFTMDVFSCKNFDHEKAIAYIKDAFDVREMDRMLVQRGLSFRGPHHGRHGATDELIAAAEARLAAGIVSNDPALPDDAPADDAPADAGLLGSRDAAIARRTQHGPDNGQEAPAGDGAGRMLWPQYGVTPDYGTYGADGQAPSGARVPLRGAETSGTPAVEPVLVNPTASISGLLDKMGAAGGQARALGRGLAAWERLLRDPEATVALALAAPVIADGLREQLVYAVEHRYVDVIVASADDLFADLYEALGHEHIAQGESQGEHTVPTPEGVEQTRAFFAEFVAECVAASPVDTLGSASALWRRLGEALRTRAPRKGLLQAAAAADVRIFTPDPATGAFGAALLALRARGVKLTLDLAEDVVALGRMLARSPRLGVVRVGAGAADGVLAQAIALAPVVGNVAPALVGEIVLGGGSAASAGEQTVMVRAEASLALPLLVTGLAQRLPGVRARRPGAVAGASTEDVAEEPALA